MPVTLLAIDTATEVCSVAIAMGDRVLERVEAVGQSHSERVLPMVHELLESAGQSLSRCDAIAFGAGPGAFTGLRIACGIAQGLAFGVGRPAIAVGNLAAVALAARAAMPGTRRTLVAIDARMQEVYWALYAMDGHIPSELAGPALAPAHELIDICRRYAPDAVAGNALLAFPGVAARLECALAPDARASAASIATLAVGLFAAGGAVPAALAAPIYVRDRVALTISERRAAGAKR